MDQRGHQRYPPPGQQVLQNRSRPGNMMPQMQQAQAQQSVMGLSEAQAQPQMQPGSSGVGMGPNVRQVGPGIVPPVQGQNSTGGTNKEALQQLMQALRNPTSSEQQQQILQILKNNPQLMAAFIKQRQIQAAQSANANAGAGGPEAPTNAPQEP